MPEGIRPALLYAMVGAGVLDAAIGPPARARLRGLLPVGFFLGVHALTIATSTFRELSWDLSVFMPVVAMVFVVTQRVLVTRAALGRLQFCLGLIAAVVAFDGASRAVLGWSPLVMERVVAVDRVSASLPHPNDLVIVPMLLPFAWEWLRGRGVRWVIGGAVVLGPAVVIALLASKSRNAWLTMGGVVFVWCWLVLGWRVALAAVGALAAFAGAAFAADVMGVRARAGDFLKLRNDGRVGLWLVALAMFRESPWLGKGVFTFGEYYKPSWFALRIDFPEGYTPEAKIIPWAHNLVLEFLAERGVVGLASFVWMVGAALASVRRRLRDAGAAAAVTAMAGFLGASLVDLTLMKDWVALLLFVLLAVLWRTGDGLGERGESRNGEEPGASQ